MIERMISEADLKNAAAEEIVKVAFKSALDEHKIVPHETPGVEMSEFDREKGLCTFVATVPLAPIVELGEYKGVKATMAISDVTDEEVDERIEALRQRKSKREAITGRGAQDGDVAVINLRRKDEEGEGKTFMVVVGKTFAGLDDSLRGMGPEEMKHVKMEFPKNFQEKDWAGKENDATITVRSLSSIILPDMDEEFVSKELKADSLDDFKARLKERLLIAKRGNAQEELNEQIQDAVVANSTIHVPDTMWQNVAAQRLRDLATEIQQEGSTVEAYAKERGMEIEELVKSYQTEAKTQVHRAVAITEIFKREAMKLNNQDLSKELVQMAAEFNISPDELLNELRKTNNMRELEYRAIFKKVLEFLNQEATIETVKA